MRRRRQLLQVSTFPFLAVLLCAMGSLILLLLVIDRRARVVARVRAMQALERAEAEESREAAAARRAAEARAAAERAEWERRRRELHNHLLEDDDSLRTQIRAAETQLSTAAGKVEAGAAAARDVRSKLQAAQTRLTEAETALHARRAEIEQKTRDAALSQAELAKLNEELSQMERTVADLKAARQRQQQTYSLVPYRGRRGDNRRPIYVECNGLGLVFHPDRQALSGVTLSLESIRDEVERRIAAARGQPGNTTGQTPYLLMLIRPDGIETYGRTLVALQGLSVEFGYEFIDADWVLDFPTDDATPATQPWMAADASSVPHPPGARKPSGPRPPLVGLRSSLDGNASAAGPTSRAGSAVRGERGDAVGGTGPVPAGDARAPDPMNRGTTNGPGLVGSDRIHAVGGTGPVPAGAASASEAMNRGTTNGPRSVGSDRIHAVGATGSVPAGNALAPDPMNRVTTNQSGPPGAGAGIGTAEMPGSASAGSSGVPPAGAAAGLGPPIASGTSANTAEAERGSEGHGSGGGSPTASLVPGTFTPLGPGAAAPPAGTPGALPAHAEVSPASPGSEARRGGLATGGSGSPGAPGAERGDGPDAGASSRASGGAATGARPASQGAGEPAGQPGGNPLLSGPGPGNGARPAPRASLILGGREWNIWIECTADALVLYPSRLRFPTAALSGGDDPLVQAVRQMIVRKQGTVRAGEPPYEPHLRFLIRPPGGLRSYYLAYPLLQGLAVPMTRENLDADEDVYKHMMAR
jgi:hypothetical protein